MPTYIKDYNQYLMEEEVIFIITPIDIQQNIEFKLKGNDLCITNIKNNYILKDINPKAVENIKAGGATLVEVGGGEVLGEYHIVLN